MEYTQGICIECVLLEVGKMKGIELTLPEFAFVESSGHDGDKLANRNVILHVRSASVMEVFETDKAYLKEDVISFDFHNTNKFGVKEYLTIALHYCATLDSNRDARAIKEQILIPAARWFCDYCDWEDKNIEKDTL